MAACFCREFRAGVVMTFHTDSASFLHSRAYTVGKAPPVHPYRRSPYFFLLASALLRSFASRIESETTRFNRNPYHALRHPRN
ncbi:hypothetical protein DVJ83_03625 [Deinococcus wulumuqiensis]|uniref:Uncharacterized protein n=1 Tax=Deinococcus wulumuqiensis TaxID=980427 RepID=A0A345IFD3_9DEIO|nr:hypothetical protein DVJ83_03625 [Deinococcus wulumuqiensis]